MWEGGSNTWHHQIDLLINCLYKGARLVDFFFTEMVQGKGGKNVSDHCCCKWWWFNLSHCLCWIFFSFLITINFHSLKLLILPGKRSACNSFKHTDGQRNCCQNGCFFFVFFFLLSRQKESSRTFQWRTLLTSHIWKKDVKNYSDSFLWVLVFADLNISSPPIHVSFC